MLVNVLFCIGFGPFTFELDGYSYLARIHFSNFRFHFSSLLISLEFCALELRLIS